MRKLFTILALLGLAVGISAQGARADTVTALGPDPTLSFSVPLSSPITMGSVNFVDSVDVMFSSLSPTPTLATIFFNPSSAGGGFSLTFPGTNDLDLEFMGPQMFSPNSTDTIATFLPGPFTIMGGTGFPSPTGSFFFDVNDMTVGGDITSGLISGATGPSVVTYTVNFETDAPIITTPEPSSLMLLGGGFLALGGIARRRLIARFN